MQRRPGWGLGGSGGSSEAETFWKLCSSHCALQKSFRHSQRLSDTVYAFSMQVHPCFERVPHRKGLLWTFGEDLWRSLEDISLFTTSARITRARVPNLHTRCPSLPPGFPGLWGTFHLQFTERRLAEAGACLLWIVNR